MDYSYGYECGQNMILRQIIAATGGKLDDMEDLTSEMISDMNQRINYTIDQLKSRLMPVYLRIAYEFDNPSYCYRSDYFKEAFRGIKRRIDERKAFNIATVWHAISGSTDRPTPTNDYMYSHEDHYDKWYPGDEYVDWIGLSRFFNGNAHDHQMPDWCDEMVDGHLKPQMPFREVHDRILDFARSHNKPVMIGESAATAYDIANLTSSCFIYNKQFSITPEEIWESWFEEYFDYIEENKDIIRNVSYISNNWQSQQFWHCEDGAYIWEPTCSSGFWGNTRIHDNPYILEKFKEKLLNPIYLNPRWLYEIFNLTASSHQEALD